MQTLLTLMFAFVCVFFLDIFCLLFTGLEDLDQSQNFSTIFGALIKKLADLALFSTKPYP